MSWNASSSSRGMDDLSSWADKLVKLNEFETLKIQLEAKVDALAQLTSSMGGTALKKIEDLEDDLMLLKIFVKINNTQSDFELEEKIKMINERMETILKSTFGESAVRSMNIKHLVHDITTVIDKLMQLVEKLDIDMEAKRSAMIKMARSKATSKQSATEASKLIKAVNQMLGKIDQKKITKHQMQGKINELMNWLQFIKKYFIFSEEQESVSESNDTLFKEQ